MNALTPVKLKNGTEEPTAVVTTTMMLLNSLLEGPAGAIDFYEAVMIARDRNHKIWSGSEERLRGLKLVPMHGSIRNVILSAVEGDGFDMSLGSPLAEVEALAVA